MNRIKVADGMQIVMMPTCNPAHGFQAYEGKSPLPYPHRLKAQLLRQGKLLIGVRQKYLAPRPKSDKPCKIKVRKKHPFVNYQARYKALAKQKK
jgi:hypothetical protein